MIVTFPVAVRSVYATAEIAAHRLAREELIEIVPYLVRPGHEFDPCLYCAEPSDAEPPWPAVFAWSWRGCGGSSVGASCAYWPCVRAVLQQAGPECWAGGITCAYPVLAGHDAGTALAA
jgi:pimeloyl-ACP methyl ester carboxylesterase